MINDWQLSGIWSGAHAAAPVRHAGVHGTRAIERRRASNLTGSPDYGARIRVVGDPGKRLQHATCTGSSTRRRSRARLNNSDGLESGNSYLKGCFISVLDLAIARNIRLGGGRNLQLRVDMFNAPNQAIITARNTSMTLSSPADPVNIQNLPYDANGNLIAGAVVAARRRLRRGHGLSEPRERSRCKCGSRSE